MSTTRDSGNFCRMHVIGRDVGEAVKYDPECCTCVKLRGHLPEGERDQPGWSAKVHSATAMHRLLTNRGPAVILPFRR